MSPNNPRKIVRVAFISLAIFLFSATVAFGQTFGNIDQSGSWASCDRCAGIGARGPTANEWMKVVSSPSMDGRSAMFNISSGTPYADALFWHELSPNTGDTHFIYDVYFYIKNPRASEALEFDTNQTAGGRRYVFGTQCGVNYDHQWDVWDTAAGTWRKTGIGCSVGAYSWNHLTWEYYRSNGQIHYVSVTLNGRKSYVNRTYGSRGRSGAEINVAFQMDQTGSHTTYQVWLDRFTLRAN